ncbi:MAG: glycoside hydrolase family 16 protein [Bacteroidota bacterium]
MKKLLYIWLIFVANMNLMSQLLPENNPNWQLVFNDEFDGPPLDITNKWRDRALDWHIGKWKVPISGYPNPIIYVDQKTMLSENFYFDSDIYADYVVLRALKKDPPVSFYVEDQTFTPSQWSWVDFYYTTPAWLCSKKTWKYGYFESSFRLTYVDTTQYTCQGLWPAFWTVGCNAFEIDIAEFQHYYYPNPDPPPTLLKNRTPTTWTHIHSDNGSVSGENIKTHINSGNFHKFAAKWSPEKVDFYIDDQYSQSLDLSGTGYSVSDILPQHIILDFGILYGDVPDATTVFPFDYQIDWVRLYQLNQRCDDDIEICSFDPSTFDFSLYKSINIGDGSCSLSLSSQNPIEMLAIDYFQINKGVTIPPGTELLLDFEQCQPDESEREEDFEDIKNTIFLRDYLRNQ